jgi:predicted ester cyclase
MVRPVLFENRKERWNATHILRCVHPIDDCLGLEEAEAQLITPLSAAFPDMVIRTALAMRGDFAGNHWQAFSGHIHGRFVAPLLGIPPTGRIAHLRFGVFERIEDDRVVETLALFDLPSLMMQAGAWPLAPAIGSMLMAPPPATGTAFWPESDAAETAKSLHMVEAMIGGLKRFDGSLGSMGMTSFWHDDFWWFGPDPIGSFQGHRDYERGHQHPFLTAFPDRVGGNHRARFAQGALIASTGWPSIHATHLGGGWLGLAPTGLKVTMRVMDFWRRDGDLLAENWVMIDIPDLLQQMGIDVFARMSALTDRS